MNLFAFRKHIDRLIHPIVAALAKLPIHANAWTAFGAVLGLVGGWMFFRAMWWPGFVVLVARGLVDHIDGYKARNFNQRSTFGAVMDDVCDRWVLGIMYAGGCLNLSYDYPHVLIVLGFGITGALTNVIIKLSIYAESQQDIWREKGKIGHPVDVLGVFFTALLHDPRPLLAGCWAVAIMSHVSLLQRVRFAWKRYRFVDPGLAVVDDEQGDGQAEAG